MLFRTYGHAVLTMHERIFTHASSLPSDPLGKLPAPSPRCPRGTSLPNGRRSGTFDNGTEFGHYQLHDLGIQTFFCDGASPWRRAGVEYGIGRYD